MSVFKSHRLPQRLTELAELCASLDEAPELERDAYGRQTSADLFEIFSSPDQIRAKGEAILEVFTMGEKYNGQPSPSQGIIPDIDDFTHILCFAISACGAPFCLDFRETENPRILWWDEPFWREFAQDFETFYKLVKARVER